MAGAMARPLLHDYFRSSAAYRVRIALRLKGVDHDSISVDLRIGEQKSEDYRARNPQGFVPMLEIDGERIGQSLAIIAYLDATRPEPPLMPVGAANQAHVQAMALAIACDIHPLNNLRVLKYLEHELEVESGARDNWYRHWVGEGFRALEQMAAPRAGRFLFGDTPTLADICLVPQIYNARRFNTPLDKYPTLVRVDAEANRLEAFAASHPDRVA
jgi:maleylacetoacetate isomerase